MKNFKHFVAAALLASATLSLSAVSRPLEDPNFELYNKTDGTIAVSVSNVKKGWRGFGEEAILLDKGDKFQTNIDMRVGKDTNIKFWVHVGDTGPKSENVLLGSYSIVHGLESTVYVSFGKKRGKGLALYPQTGPMMGFKGKTESGLPLDKNKNVPADQIVEKLKYDVSRGGKAWLDEPL